MLGLDFNFAEQRHHVAANFCALTGMYVTIYRDDIFVHLAVDVDSSGSRENQPSDKISFCYRDGTTAADPIASTNPAEVGTTVDARRKTNANRILNIDDLSAGYLAQRKSGIANVKRAESMTSRSPA